MSHSQAKRPLQSRGKVDRTTIARAALALVDADGVAGLSARKLAARLGCEAMSLYHHVEGMGEVQDLIVDHLVGSLRCCFEPDSPPLAVIHEFAQAYLSLARAHPNAFVLVTTRLWRTPQAVGTAEAAVETLERLGLSKQAAQRWARVLAAYLHGAGLAISAWDRDTSGRAGRVTVIADLQDGLQQLLRALEASARTRARPKP